MDKIVFSHIAILDTNLDDILTPPHIKGSGTICQSIKCMRTLVQIPQYLRKSKWPWQRRKEVASTGVRE